jgi:cytochrome P450 / NADPH-cytochrome P450 reductase
MYEDELRTFEAQGITKLYVAFTRVPDRPKQYVQAQIECLPRGPAGHRGGAIIDVCCDTGKTALDVGSSFTVLYRAKTGGSEADAEAWLSDLTAVHRYLTDLWATANHPSEQEQEDQS